MDDKLNQKLREDIAKAIWDLYTLAPSQVNKENAVYKLVDFIEQAFADAGYVKIPQVTEIRNTDPNTTWQLSDKKLTVNGKEVMTGQDWYERLKVELEQWSEYINYPIHPFVVPEVLSCAKRASNIEDTK